MKINKKFLQTIIFLIVYLFGLYFWSQPYQERGLPYGEYDAMSHFEVADYMSYNDRSFIDLPPYIDLRYGYDNKYRPHTLWYPPTFHSSLGVMQIFGGDRILAAFFLNTLLATFIIVTVYFVVRSLFGFLPAILSSAMLIFSPRDFLPYLWGQWPERFAYAFIPIILYCFYVYLKSYSKGEKKPIYLFLTALFLGIDLLVHPMSFFHAMLGVAVFYVLFLIKKRKFYFNWKHVSISVLIFFIIYMMFPLQTFNVAYGFVKAGGGESDGLDLSRLFKWSLDPNDYAGSVPAFYFSFKDVHGMWTLPFLLLGILILLIRRKDKDLLMLAWLISLYIVLHRDMFGKAAFLHRSLSATAHIFIPLTAIGGAYLISLLGALSKSFLNIPGNFQKYIKYGATAVVVIIFVYFTYNVNMAFAKQFLNEDIYNPYSQSGFFTTLNDAEVDVNNWILQNVPPGYNVSVIGFPVADNIVGATSKKIRWSAAVSQHVTRFYHFLEDKNASLENHYIMMDYTMLGPLNDQQTFNMMQSFEINELANHTLLYDKDNIRVYKYEG